LRKLPQANTLVANSTSQGTSRAKNEGGVLSSRTAPNRPPMALMISIWRKVSGPTSATSLRPA
jgi:hypothetical protein